MGEGDEALIHAGYTWPALSLHAEATFLQGKNFAKFYKNILKLITLACWYSFESSR